MPYWSPVCYRTNIRECVREMLNLISVGKITIETCLKNELYINKPLNLGGLSQLSTDIKTLLANYKCICCLQGLCRRVKWYLITNLKEITTAPRVIDFTVLG